MTRQRVGTLSGELSTVFFFQAEDGIRDYKVTGVQTCALPISFVHLGHKLRATRPVHGNRQEHEGDRRGNNLRFPTESPANDRSVDTHEWPGDAVILL